MSFPFPSLSPHLGARPRPSRPSIDEDRALEHLRVAGKMLAVPASVVDQWARVCLALAQHCPASTKEGPHD